MLDKNERFLVCPFTRNEILVSVGDDNNEIACPICKKNHLLPDGKFHTMDELKKLNMVQTSW